MVKKVSILPTILLTFVSICILLVITLLILYNSLEKLYLHQKELANETIPELSDVFTITDTFNSIRSNIYRIMREQSKLVYLTELETTKVKIEDIGAILLTLEGSSKYDKQVKYLSVGIIELSKTVNDVEIFLNQRTNIIEQRHLNSKKLRLFAQKLEVSSKNAPSNMHSTISALQSTLTHLMILCTDIDAFYGLRIIDEVKEKIQRINENTSMFTDMDKEINNLMQKIILIAEEKNGIFYIFNEYDTIQNKIISISINLETLSNEVSSVSNFLLQEINANAHENSEVFEENISYLYYLISVTALCTLVLSLILYKFLSSLVIKPIVSLNRFLALRSEGVREKISHTGLREIQSISHAVDDFIYQIEEREQKLQESHTNLESQVIARTSKITKLSEKIIGIQEQERFKLAAELHDDVGASMGVIKFSIERALKMLGGEQTAQAQISLAEAVNIIKSVVRQLRRIQTDLRPPYLDIGLLKTLEWFVLDYKTAHPNVQMQADFFFDDIDLSPTLQIVIFRIIQEALNNISKYSQATKITIQVIHDEELSVLIEDNGRGFFIENLQNSQVKNSGHGIRNIQERVTISSGHFSIDSFPGKGTSVRAVWNADLFKM